MTQPKKALPYNGYRYRGLGYRLLLADIAASNPKGVPSPWIARPVDGGR